MSNIELHPSFCQGKPGFDSSELTSIASAKGATAAWEEAFRRRGPHAPVAVSGDFAVFIGDDGQGRSYAAVDRFGIRSLCYRVINGKLQCAPRADELAGPDADLDPQAIFDYLYFHCIPSPRTIFRGVYRIPPGHVVFMEHGELRVQAYWTPEFREPAHADFEALKTRFRTLLEQAVDAQLDSGKPGCFLSGGTDSSTVAGMIGRVRGRPAASYSIGFDAAGYDEMAYARLAARAFGTEHHEHYVTPQDLVDGIPGVAAHCDQPFGNSSVLPAYYCARMARTDGVTRILAGDGGDELFGGNSRYAKQRVFGLYQAVPAALRSHVLEPLLERSVVGRMPGLTKARSYVEQAKVGMPDRLEMYNLLLRLGPPDMLTADLLSQIDASEPTRLQRSVWQQSGDGCSELNRTLAFDWRFTLAESDLPKVRNSCELADIEVGFPMLSRDLLDFSMGLPDHYKLRGLKLRWFFKEALRGFLPDEILAKRKQGFGLPFGVWLTKTPALMDLARASLESLCERRLLRREFQERLFREHLPIHPGYYGEQVWILMMLEQWLRAHAPRYRLG